MKSLDKKKTLNFILNQNKYLKNFYFILTKKLRFLLNLAFLVLNYLD
jgi:hypothetical protein